MSRKLIFAALLGAAVATGGLAYAADTAKPAQTTTAPAKPAPKPSLYTRAQTKLKDLGDYSGPINGQRTKATVAAIEKFQKDKSIKVSGRLTPETVKALGV
jgi:peptidoglycan hydrolase-like protein with peptidoglycan-binding domain